MQTFRQAVLLFAVAACSLMPKMTQGELVAYMRSQAAMPVCNGVKVREVSYENVGQDYSVPYRVDAAESCLIRWRQELGKNPLHECQKNRCSRFVYQGFNEEQADIYFGEPQLAEVEFGKI